MNDTLIVTSFVVIDEVLKTAGHRCHAKASVPDREVLWLAGVAAIYVQNHHARTVYVMPRLGYLSGQVRISRFNRRLHRLGEWLEPIVRSVGALLTGGEIYVIDSLPIPVCRRVRASRCRKVRGKVYCGYCAAKGEKYFGWKLPVLCTQTGIPVTFELLPAALHDLTPLHELASVWPSGAFLLGDKGYISAADKQTLLLETGVRLVPQHRNYMEPNTFLEQAYLRWHRKSIETFNSLLEKMGVQRLHARTNSGLDLKIHPSFLALICFNE
jgi:hypothetical protein